MILYRYKWSHTSCTTTYHHLLLLWKILFLIKKRYLWFLSETITRHFILQILPLKLRVYVTSIYNDHKYEVCPEMLSNKIKNWWFTVTLNVYNLIQQNSKSIFINYIGGILFILFRLILQNIQNGIKLRYKCLIIIVNGALIRLYIGQFRLRIEKYCHYTSISTTYCPIWE